MAEQVGQSEIGREPGRTRSGNATGLQRNLPNVLTIGRVVLAGGFIALMTLPSYALAESDNRLLLGLALALFVTAALTDALDGYLARKWNVVSVFGRIMDPFADKVLVLGAFVMLAGPQFSMAIFSEPLGLGESAGDPIRVGSLQITGIQSWMVVVILARDLLVTSLRGMVEGRGKSFAALSAGKVKMVVQSVGIPLILATLMIVDRPTEGWARWIILVSAWGVTLLTAWSAIPYCLDARRKLMAP